MKKDIRLPLPPPYFKKVQKSEFGYADIVKCHNDFFLKSIFIVTLVLTFLIPINVCAKSPFYIDFKPGIYSPHSSGIDGFDTGSMEQEFSTI